MTSTVTLPSVETPAVAPAVPNPFTGASVEGKFKHIFRQLKDAIYRFLYGAKAASAAERTVQVELALEKVQVLRNDLNEDDWEVVLVQRRVGRGEKPLARLSRMEMTGDAWIKLTAPFRKKSGESAINSKAETASSPELSARA